ncbi:putative transcriptional regulator of viral defense system [Clostridiales Family XIII bacterium PM5-7]
MTNYDVILNMANKHNGIVTTRMVRSSGIAPQYLKRMLEQGCFEKTVRGVYVLPEVLEDEFVSLQARFKKGVYAKETALFLHDLTDRTPVAYVMTFPDGYNLTNVKEEGVIANRAKEPYYSLGVEKGKSPSGNEVLVYNPEKTLCDILRPKSGVEKEVTTEAFKRYISKKERNIPLLSEYATKLKVEDKVRSYLEVLL